MFSIEPRCVPEKGPARCRGLTGQMGTPVVELLPSYGSVPALVCEEVLCRMLCVLSFPIVITCPYALNKRPCSQASSCPICLEDLHDGDTVDTQQCGHQFHKNCLRVSVGRWLPPLTPILPRPLLPGIQPDPSLPNAGTTLSRMPSGSPVCGKRHYWQHHSCR